MSSTKFASDPKRWTASVKAGILTDIRSGKLTVEEACRIYNLSEEEVVSWWRLHEQAGTKGLRTTRIQVYRGSGKLGRA